MTADCLHCVHCRKKVECHCCFSKRRDCSEFHEQLKLTMSEATKKCRLCLRKIDGKTGSNITDHDFRSMMSSVFYFWVPNGYAMPKSVCLQCYSTVSDFYCYSKTVEANQQLLKQDPLKLDCENENQECNDLELVEVKIEPMPDDGDQEDDLALTDTTPDNGKESEPSAAAGSPRVKPQGRPHPEEGSHPTEDYHKGKSRSERLEDGTTQRGECPVCKKTFGYHYLKHHISSHRDPLRCEVCGKAFTTKKSLTRHKTTVHSFPKKRSLYSLIPI